MQTISRAAIALLSIWMLTGACSCALGGFEAGLSEAEPTEIDGQRMAEGHMYGEEMEGGASRGRTASATVKPSIRGAYISEGIWSVNLAEAERQLAEIGALGANVVIDYQLQAPTDLTKTGPGTYWRRYMDAATAANVKVAFPLKTYLKGLTPTDGTSNAYFEKVREVVRAIRSEPAIGYWYVHDEKLPSTNISKTGADYTISIEQMQALYNLIKAEDATAVGGKARPQMQVWVSLPAFTSYKNRFTTEYRPYGDPTWLATESAYNTMLTKMVQQCADVVMVDNYPVGNPGVPAGTPVDQYPRTSLVRAKSLLKAGQPFVFVFQSFSWKVFNPTGAPNATYPTLAEMRTMLTAARDNGCTGAIAYNWYDLDNPPDSRKQPGYEQCFADLKTVLRQLNTSWP